jgi:hypothetical protein
MIHSRRTFCPFATSIQTRAGRDCGTIPWQSPFFDGTSASPLVLNFQAGLPVSGTDSVHRLEKMQGTPWDLANFDRIWSTNLI